MNNHGTDHTSLVRVDTLLKNDNSWFVTSQIPTDLSIQVQDTTFNVHKYPLVSKCGYIGHHELHDLKLQDFPGGSETFEIILKFCYGLPVDLNPDNIAPLRCASEFLQMTEELEQGNLISKAEAFLTFVLLSSWRDNITILKSCGALYPWAENLQIVRRCCDSIAHKASRDNNSSSGDAISESWWVGDVAALGIDHFLRILTAIKAKGAKAEIIGKCIMHYAHIWLPDMDAESKGLKGYMSILSGRKDEENIGYKEQRSIIESLVSLIPTKQGAVTCKFLLQMLKMAMVFSVSPALVSELEKRAGMVLEEATVSDLMIPRYKHGEEDARHDLDAVQRIVEYSVMHEQQQQIQGSVNNYLAEIGKEPNLSITMFQVLAESLPERARTCHDGLYRARLPLLSQVSLLLGKMSFSNPVRKAHPSMSEHDRGRVCKLMNSEKLSLDACMHAAHNERLPLRTVIQVLLSEQIKMREAMQPEEQEGGQSSTPNEIKALKAELEQVKTQMMELQQDYSDLQHDHQKINTKPRNVSPWTFGWKKIKNATISNGDGKQRSKSGKRLSIS